MANNIQLEQVTTAGATLATDDIAGVHHQKVKIEYGGEDSATEVSATNPLPVDLRADNLSGNLDVNLAASAATVTVAQSTAANLNCTETNSGAIRTAVEKADNIAHTRNAAFVESAAVGGELDDTSPVAATEGNVSPVRITAQRAFHVNLRDTSGNPLGTAGNGLTVVGGGGTLRVDSVAEKTEDSAHASGDTGVVILGVRNDARIAPVSADGDYQTLQFDSTGRLYVQANLRNNSGTEIGTSGSPIRVDPTGTTTQPVSGTVTANAGTGTFTVDQTDDEARMNGVVRKDVDPSDGVTQLTTQFKVINAGTSGDNTIVPAVTGKKIRVLSVALVATAAVSCEWRSGTTAISGAMSFAANGGYTLSSDYGIFETAAGQALVLNLSAATAVDGHLSYVEI